MMTKEERMVIANGLICVLDILKAIINPYVMKDERLIDAAMKYIESTKKQLEELKPDEKAP